MNSSILQMKPICVAMSTNLNTIAKLAVNLWVANSASLTLMLNAMDVMNNAHILMR
jgi:hypothetical protein